MFFSTKQRLAAVLVSGAAVAGVTACGGGSSDATLSHADLVSKANASCQKASKTVAGLQLPSGQAGLAGYTGKVKAATVQMENEIAGLKPNAQDQKAVTQYLDAVKQSNAILTKLQSAAQQGNVAAIRQFGSNMQDLGLGVAAARAGLHECSLTPTTQS
jgi:hypothetical protein